MFEHPHRNLALRARLFDLRCAQCDAARQDRGFRRTSLSEVNGGRPKTQPPFQLREAAEFRFASKQTSFARSQQNQERQSLGTADIGRKTQEASDGLTTMSLLALPFLDKFAASPRRGKLTSFGALFALEVTQ
jgi:hypothetical protein